LRKLLICLLLLASTFCSAMERQPNSAYRARREALAQLTKGGVVLLFAPMEGNGLHYGFFQDVKFYYLTGLNEPGAALMIVGAAEATTNSPARPYSEILFLPAQNPVAERWTGPKLVSTTANAKDLTGFDRVERLDSMRDELFKVLNGGGRGSCYTDTSSDSPSTGPLEWLRRANAFPRGGCGGDVTPLIGQLRLRKDAGEVALIRKATDASVAAHLAVMKAMRPGKTEREIASLFEYEYGKRGCERGAYPPIVGSGLNSTVLHYEINTGTIEDGDVVVMDVGGEYSMYATDITRTLPANGKFTPRQREIYEIVLGAQKAAVAAFVSGKSMISGFSPDSIHKVAFDYINSHGKDKNGEPLGKYFIHGLSHTVGLDVHDGSTQGRPLEPGNVFTIEPGIYIPEEKIGVRIEDTFWVNEKGELVNLSAALPSNPDEVEKVMAEARAAEKPAASATKAMPKKR
jgi:Xaa-Pro aminopeptidase